MHTVSVMRKAAQYQKVMENPLLGEEAHVCQTAEKSVGNLIRDRVNFKGVAWRLIVRFAFLEITKQLSTMQKTK